MALTPSFTISPTSAGSTFILNDTSTGSDGAIASRQILLTTITNAPLVGAIPWIYANPSITISPLIQDIALNITIQWLDSSGNMLYTSSQIYAFVQFGQLFLYGLTQNQTGQPTLLNDQNYLQYKFLVMQYLNSATQAINVGGDIYSAQSCIALYQNIINNQALYFGGSN